MLEGNIIHVDNKICPYLKVFHRLTEQIRFMKSPRRDIIWKLFSKLLIIKYT